VCNDTIMKKIIILKYQCVLMKIIVMYVCVLIIMININMMCDNDVYY